jgi:hypothetical protein
LSKLFSQALVAIATLPGSNFFESETTMARSFVITTMLWCLAGLAANAWSQVGLPSMTMTELGFLGKALNEKCPLLPAAEAQAHAQDLRFIITVAVEARGDVLGVLDEMQFAKETANAPRFARCDDDVKKTIDWAAGSTHRYAAKLRLALEHDRASALSDVREKGTRQRGSSRAGPAPDLPKP